jgi:RNA polymerase sigma-70 factor (ECF subfamily)
MKKNRDWNSHRSEGGGARRETFAQEVMVYLDHLYRVALHLARDEEEAQDLTQETFAALASYDQFRPGTNMKAWLTKILQNFLFDRNKGSAGFQRMTRPEKQPISARNRQRKTQGWKVMSCRRNLAHKSPMS